MTRSKCSDDIKVIRPRCLCNTRLKFSREKRVIFNNFRYSVRFLDSNEMLVYIIDTLTTQMDI